MKIKVLLPVLLLFIPFLVLNAGTHGKLKGRVIDKQTKEGVFGANIVIDGTYLGASADVDGNFIIANIPPGEYSVTVSAVSYHKVKMQRVLIKIDLTTTAEFELTPSVVNLSSEVVVTASRPLVQKDMTSTNAIVTASDIKMMPVEEVGQVVNLQAGVVGGHFRGGRSNEVVYLIDGVSVTDAYDGGVSMALENSIVRQMEVISGTFNAEYGQAMSGVVNIVTQDGSTNFESSVSGYVGNYVTTHSSIFKNLDKYTRLAQKNIQFSLSGPTGLGGLTFFLTGRYYEDIGYLYGKRVYNITDDVPFFPDQSNTNFFIARNTGDGKYISMNPSRKFSASGKLTYSMPDLKFSYGVFWDDNKNKYYDHYYSWTPDGKMTHFRTNTIHSFQISHYPTANTYQALKFAYDEFNYKGYLHEDPYDPAYIDPSRGTAITNYTFRSGGNEGGRYKRYTNSFIAQYNLSSQINQHHKIGFGAEFKKHLMYTHDWDLVNLTEGQTDTLTNLEIWTPGYPADGAITDYGRNISMTRSPIEASAYIQDKIEYDIMIINAGVRLDYFDAKAGQPLDKRNPRNNSDFPGYSPNGVLLKQASAKYQLSPRFGASFPITDKGIIRFSYGHFFQVPSYNNLYANPTFFVQPGQSLSSVLGNPDLKVQKTVMYEIGLQQIFMDDLVMNLTVYYRDIRNLLGVEIINTYEGFKYARYINRDYGNVRGFLITVDKRLSSLFSAKLDYTYQIAEGNSSDPMTNFNNNQADPPVEETKKVLPLDWDQRHTLNLSLNMGIPGDWTVGMILSYGSGFPYTEDIKISQGVLFENGGIKPATYNVDFRADKNFDLGFMKLNAYLLIYNLFDIKNQNGVYSTTGKANVDLNTKYAGSIVGLNTIQEYVNNPSMYSTPREIRIGFGFSY